MKGKREREGAKVRGETQEVEGVRGERGHEREGERGSEGEGKGREIGM